MNFATKKPSFIKAGMHIQIGDARGIVESIVKTQSGNYKTVVKVGSSSCKNTYFLQSDEPVYVAKRVSDEAPVQDEADRLSKIKRTWSDL